MHFAAFIPACIFPPPLSVHVPWGDDDDGDDPSPSLGGTADGGGVEGVVLLLGLKRELSLSSSLGLATGGAGRMRQQCWWCVISSESKTILF